jgi:hypothetical protein
MRTVASFVLLLCVVFAITISALAIELEVISLKNPKAIECPYCHKPIVAGGIHENAIQTLTTEFGGSLTERDVAYTTSDPTEGQRLSVFVYRFEERQGGNFSVLKPASVGFHVHLYQGRTLASVFVFDETQRPLSENVLRLPSFLKRGAKWITVEELAREGVHKALDSFSDVLQNEAPQHQ